MECWLVERDYDDKGLVRLTYATPDGSQYIIMERSERMLREGVAAAEDIDPDRLAAVEDPDVVERYAGEVAWMRDRHDPDDRV